MNRNASAAPQGKSPWYIHLNNELNGPMDEAVVLNLIRTRVITSATMMTRDGKAFAPAGECLDAALFQTQSAGTSSTQKPLDEDECFIDFDDGNAKPAAAQYGASNNNVTSVAPVIPGARPMAQQIEERYQPSRPMTADGEDVSMCPHCWTLFPFEDVLYVARHPDLIGDIRLGSDTPQRFRATRFTPDGMAIDPGGMVSQEMACPNCHMEVPRGTVEMKPEFFSIVGAPSSGKSYYLASLTWALRQTMAQDFAFSFTDAETTMNQLLHQYEEKLFLHSDPNEFVTLEKTQEMGETYSNVSFNGQITWLPRPFIFSMKAQAHNPVAGNKTRNARSIVLYDNAGEHFLPGKDTVLRPCHHLVHSRCLFFLLDPTQDPRFRARVNSDDPQVRVKVSNARQDVLLNEAARRIRRHLGQGQNKKIAKQLVVIVSKFDVWKDLLKMPIRPNPTLKSAKSAVSGLDARHIEDVSFSVRELLRTICPELVVAAEDFSDDVTFVPVSALGHSPTACSDPVKPGGTALLVRPGEIQPFWVAVPFLYALARAGYLCFGASKPESPETVLLAGSVGGFLTCEFADGTQLTVTEKYAGKIIHNPVTGKPFIVPKPVPSEAQSPQ